MDRSTAVALFDSLDKEREIDPTEAGPRQWNPPVYDVRLDAYTDDRQAGVELGDGATDDGRRYRVRVTPGASSGGLDLDAWQFVLEEAARIGRLRDTDEVSFPPLSVLLGENGGITIR